MMATDQVTPISLKFQEAIDFLKNKLPAPTLAWDDLAGPVHSKVFAVAGATKADLVNDLHAAVTQAIDEGQSITQFRKNFDKAVAAHGWTYKGKRGWRTRVIYDNNMRSAHMAGRWQQIQASKDRRPYLQYRTAGDARVRPQHRQWDGKVYPVDHSFWDTHYPPNGWGCRCTIRSLTRDDLAERGLSVETERPTGKSRLIVNKDGEITDMVPLGIDAGWDHNVGKAWLAPEIALGEKLARLPVELRGLMSQKTVTPQFQAVINDRFKQFRSSVKDTLKSGQTLAQAGDRGVAQLVGYLDDATLHALAAEGIEVESTAVAVLNNRLLHLDGAHKAATEQPWADALINALPEMFANYRAVVLDTKPDQQALIFVPQQEVNGRLGKITTKVNQKSRWGGAKQRIVSVVSLGAVEKGAFKARITVNGKAQQRYKVLLGKL